MTQLVLQFLLSEVRLPLLEGRHQLNGLLSTNTSILNQFMHLEASVSLISGELRYIRKILLPICLLEFIEVLTRYRRKSIHRIQSQLRVILTNLVLPCVSQLVRLSQHLQLLHSGGWATRTLILFGFHIE